jgi:hypothetical protein
MPRVWKFKLPWIPHRGHRHFTGHNGPYSTHSIMWNHHLIWNYAFNFHLMKNELRFVSKWTTTTLAVPGCLGATSWTRTSYQLGQIHQSPTGVWCVWRLKWAPTVFRFVSWKRHFFFVFLRNSCQSQQQVSPVMSSVLTDRLVWGNTGFARPSPSECYYPPHVWHQFRHHLGCCASHK